MQNTQSEEPNRRGPVDNVEEAATQSFHWGLNLADALGEVEEWGADLWSVLISAWSKMELSEDKYHKVLYWLSQAELYPKHNREIAEALYALVKPGGTSYALNLLPQANEIAAALWHYLDRTGPIEERKNWLDSAFYHPAGYLASFWVWGGVLWREHQDPKPAVFSDEHRAALSDIVGDQSLPGRFGRTVLANQFANLLALDKRWTREYILPLFKPASDDFQAAWDGFLTRVRLNPNVAEAMVVPSLKAVKQINNRLFDQRDQFIEYYLLMLVYFVEDPIDKWIPKFFRYAGQELPIRAGTPVLFPRDVQETKDFFAAQVGSLLRKMTEAKRQKWWQRWLKCYWKNRLQGVPAVLDSGEVAQMVDWLPHLTSVFPEAVDLAVQMPQGSLKNSWIIAELNASDENSLWQEHPESVARLLIYLWKSDLPEYSWDSVQQLIDKLLPLNISSERKQELQEIRIQL